MVGLFAYYLFANYLLLENDFKNGDTVFMKKGEYQFYIKENQGKNRPDVFDLSFQKGNSTVSFTQKKKIKYAIDIDEPLYAPSVSICENDDCYESIGTLFFENEGDYIVKFSNNFSYAYQYEEKDEPFFLTAIIYSSYATIALLIITVLFILIYIIQKIRKK